MPAKSVTTVQGPVASANTKVSVEPAIGIVLDCMLPDNGQRDRDRNGSPQGKTAWLSKPYLVPPKGQPAGSFCMGLNGLSLSHHTFWRRRPVQGLAQSQHRAEGHGKQGRRDP